MTYSRRITDMPTRDSILENFALTTRPATSKQRWVAFILGIALIVSTLLLLPYAPVRWPKIPSFLPIYQTAVIETFLVTAYLMYAHYKATRSEALLHLAAGCLYTAAILVLQFFSFQGMLIEGEVLFGGAQTAIWLWFFWHAGAAMGLLLFAWREFRTPGYVTIDHRRSVRATALVLLSMLALTIIWVTAFHTRLPILDINGDYRRITSSGVAPALQVLLGLSLFFLWQASRFRNVLHLWLGIALAVLLCDNILTMAGGSRLSLGWYVGRLSALLASTIMMVAYLKEMNRSHQQSLHIVGKLDNERNRAEDQLLRSNTQLRQLVEHQEIVKEEERKRIARDLHDDLGQSLMVLKIDVSMLHTRTRHNHPRLHQHAQRVLDTVDATMKSVRSIINDLYPGTLELGLCAAIDWLLKQFESRNAIHCNLIVVDDSQNAQLSKRQVTTIFRIVQESLANVVRHANATQVEVALHLTNKRMTVVITDNGIGMQPRDHAKPGSFGIKGMRERINVLGGELIIDSGDGRGTTLSIWVPLTEPVISSDTAERNACDHGLIGRIL